MKDVMQGNSVVRDAMYEHEATRNQKADRLIEKWNKIEGIGDGLAESASGKNLAKARNVAILLENTKNSMSRMTEAQLSSAYGNTPENALRLVRLGYGRGIRSEVFSPVALQTANDTIFYLSSVYASSLRDATAGNITHESSASRYPSEQNVESPTQTPNGSITVFTGPSSGNLAQTPVRPYTVQIYVDGVPVAMDNGAGVISNIAPYTLLSAGTINYTTGAISLTFAVAPATGTEIKFWYRYDSEVVANYSSLGEVNLQLSSIQLHLFENRLGVSWSKLSEILIGTTLSVDQEEALLKAAADELTKALDFGPLKMGYAEALKQTARTFDANYASAGADSYIEHVQGINRIIEDTGDDIYNSLNRGGVSEIYGASSAVNILMDHRDFVAEPNGGMKIGGYKVGTLRGVNIYKVPSSIVPQSSAYADLVCVWKNPDQPEDMALVIGDYLPFYRSQTLEFKNGQTETSVTRFGSDKVLQPAYFRRIRITNPNMY